MASMRTVGMPGDNLATSVLLQETFTLAGSPAGEYRARASAGRRRNFKLRRDHSRGRPGQPKVKVHLPVESSPGSSSEYPKLVDFQASLPRVLILIMLDAYAGTLGTTAALGDSYRLCQQTFLLPKAVRVCWSVCVNHSTYDLIREYLSLRTT